MDNLATVNNLPLITINWLSINMLWFVICIGWRYQNRFEVAIKIQRWDLMRFAFGGNNFVWIERLFRWMPILGSFLRNRNITIGRFRPVWFFSCVCAFFSFSMMIFCCCCFFLYTSFSFLLISLTLPPPPICSALFTTDASGVGASGAGCWLERTFLISFDH